MAKDQIHSTIRFFYQPSHMNLVELLALSLPIPRISSWLELLTLGKYVTGLFPSWQA